MSINYKFKLFNSIVMSAAVITKISIIINVNRIGNNLMAFNSEFIQPFLNIVYTDIASMYSLMLIPIIASLDHYFGTKT